VREIIRQAQFKTDLRRIARSGRYKVADLLTIVDDLANDRLLAPKHRDHTLSGNWQQYRECHIKADWLLIYKLEPGRLILVRTGSHSELWLLEEREIRLAALRRALKEGEESGRAHYSLNGLLDELDSDSPN